MMKNLLILATLLALLNGCSLSPQECATMDWRWRGEADGAAGHLARPSHWQAQCSEHGYRIDDQAYYLGWQQGNGRYCEPGNGFLVGRRGEAYSGACQGEVAERFLAQYERGYRIYQEEQRLAYLRDRIHDIEHRIHEIGGELRRDELDREARRELRHERRRLEDELAELRHALLFHD
ncbi:DUF2799 domain-containing protein [Gallaecimonas sp. GXIMD4217]|uniref:DUF2799 domain-containing protein n=1 Tax=Gallaecimonas sp. GXIMD4217 TaxID=3131927 RepID=UPI00311ACD0F